MAEDTATIGHNRAPFISFYNEQNAALPDYLADEHAAMLRTADDLKAEFENTPGSVDSDEDELLLTDIGVRLAKFAKTIDAQRTLDKAPTLQAGRIVDNFYASMSNKVQPCLDAAKRRVNAWKDQKAAIARREREEREREAARVRAEAEAARVEAERIARDTQDAERKKDAEAVAARMEKEAKAAEKQVHQPSTISVNTRAESGAQSTQSMRWTGEITNIEELDLVALRPYIGRAALDVAVRQYALQHKDTKPLAGARIFERSNTSFKG